MSRIIKFTRSLRSRRFFFDRPLVLLQSDDWGRVGVRDADGLAELQAGGLTLGENPYDFYSLETAEDVEAVHELLSSHRDSIGRSPCLTMNFVLANLDFQQIFQSGCQQIHLKPLRDSLPGKWRRPGLFDAYRSGIADGVFYPALHGLTHFCRPTVERALEQHEARRHLLQTLWHAGTPYIFWRMPWVGYEYYDPAAGAFLSFDEQLNLVQSAVRAFAEFFGTAPLSACAPGYRANHDTQRAWASCGVRVAQHGGGSGRAPHLDEFGLLNLYRVIDFEPAVHSDFVLDRCLEQAEECFARGLPAIVSVHSINFHSSLRNFRGPTLAALDRFCAALETRHPDLLYLNDAGLRGTIERGQYQSTWGRVLVRVKQSSVPQVAARGI